MIVPPILVHRSLAGWLLTLAVLFAFSTPAFADELVVWHAYRGAEEEGLHRVIERWNQDHPGSRVRLLPIAYEAFANRLTSAIPRGHGPDVFIAAHERVGDWHRSGLLLELPDQPEANKIHHPLTIDALQLDGQLLGVPLAFKGLALFYNTDLLDAPPTTTDEMIAFARAATDSSAGTYGLAYEVANFYMHIPWFTGFGAQIFDNAGRLVIDSPEAARSLEFAHHLVHEEQIVPREPTGALVAHLFNTGTTPMAISGPWFLGEIDDSIPFDIAPLPVVSETGRQATPFLTVEAAFVSARTQHPQKAVALARFLARHDMAVERALVGLQPVSTLSAYEHPDVRDHEILSKFRAQLDTSLPMPNDPRMRSVWEPATQALGQVLRGVTAPPLALEQAERRIHLYTRPPPEAANPVPLIVGLILFALFALIVGISRFRRHNLLPQMKAALPAYLYMAPAIFGMILLIVIPFVVGSAVSLFSHTEGEFTFVGLANFTEIIFSKEYGLSDPHSFYFTLGVTILWTALNVFFHVSIGLFLALLLRDPWMKLRGLYRVLLIIPWAIPNYITALIWRGMFDEHLGAINAILIALGADPVSWFSQFTTAFAANLVTNTWLGFPFMMVVTLGALQAIPSDLEEAASVDGANRWQRFRHVTWPLLKPALIPAVVLGTVWTFNMFNIIYLVSGGAPDGSTEILISEAYKWAFTRQEQYGYAAAYAVLIFFVLLGYGLLSGQLKTENADSEGAQ